MLDPSLIAELEIDLPGKPESPYQMIFRYGLPIKTYSAHFYRQRIVQVDMSKKSSHIISYKWDLELKSKHRFCFYENAVMLWSIVFKVEKMR